MKQFFAIVMVFANAVVFCQVQGISISPTGSAPDPSAIFDVSSTTKGELIPRMSKAQRNSINNPALGLLIYDTTTECIEVYGFGNWQPVSCLCTGPPSVPAAITGNNNPCANQANLVFSVPLILNVTNYTWTVPSDAIIIAGQGSNSITVNFGLDTGSITVTANNGCGASSAASVPVNIVTTPSAPGNINGNAYPCANSGSQGYFIATVSGATSYNWSAPSGATIAFGQGTNSIFINFTSTPGNIVVNASNACGTSSASTLPISMASAAPLNPGTIHGDSTFAPNQSEVLYYIAPVSNANAYTWSVPSDAAITAGQGTDSIRVTFGSNSGNICVTASNCMGTSSSCFTVHNNCYTPGTQTFNYTGAQQSFTVPCGVPWVNISTYGAQGGSQYGNGALGGYADGTLSVTGGETLYVFVGGQNGYNGGGAGADSSSGGGMSDVRVGGTGFNNWVLVAGGGGGGGYKDNFDLNTTTGTGGGGVQCVNGAGGGGGGYLLTTNASQGCSGTCTTGGDAGISSSYFGGGGGGGLTGGGAGGNPGAHGTTPGSSGTQGQGGASGANQYNNGSGGGGGGYYGGGGADEYGGSGGGGSSWASLVMTNTSFTGGVQSGNGVVVITW